jgi:four helix bundle protein
MPSNIAEDSRRSSKKHYRHYAEISLGYSYELETHLLIAQRLFIGDQDLILKTLTDVSGEQRMLVGSINILGRWRSALPFSVELACIMQRKA